MKSIIFSFLLLMSFALSAQTINMNTTYTSSTSITPFGSINSISSLNITGSATLLNDTGIVRLILVDNNLNEYLLYEGHVFSMTGSTMSFSAYTDETQYLNNIKPSSILIIAKNASVTINTIQYVTTVTTNTLLQTQTLTAAFYKTKIDARIATMNTRLAQLGYTWTATSTGSSYLTYSSKRAVYGLGSDDFNNYSEEHYASGPLDFPPLSQPLSSFPSSSGLKSNQAISFDWRFRHGATNIKSPYYNSHEGCSGWINQKREQLWEENKCGTCVLFGTVAMIENVMNVYYNRHIDYDLSEKAMAICNYDNKAACDGIGFSFPIETITTDGLMKESCYPYPKPKILPYNMDEPCSAKSTAYNNCTDKELVRVNPNKTVEPIFISTTDDKYVLDVMKKLVKYGPLYTGYAGHAFSLVGWDIDIDNNMNWYYKNSNFDPLLPVQDGINKVAKDQLVNLGYLQSSLYSSSSSLPSCVDIDRDGYYVYTNKTLCPSSAPINQDSDDNDNSIGPNGATITASPVPTITFTPSQIISWVEPDRVFYNGSYHNGIIAGDVVVNCKLLKISTKIEIQPTAKFIIKSGSAVIINGNATSNGSISCGSFVIENGGYLKILAGADINPIVVNSQYATFQDLRFDNIINNNEIFSSNYTESDRVCADMDGDGYYNWGIGAKPATCPPCADIEDGDDWNASIGEIDEYGQPKTFVPITVYTQNVSSSTTWTGENIICGDLVIKNNTTLTLSSTGSIKMQAGRKLTIEGNSSLIIQGGKVSMANIVVNSGGTLTLDNDGIIELCNKVSSLTVNGVFNHNKGSVNIVNPFDPK